MHLQPTTSGDRKIHDMRLAVHGRVRGP